MIWKQPTNGSSCQHGSYKAAEHDQGCKSRVHRDTLFHLTTLLRDQFTLLQFSNYAGARLVDR